MLKTVVIIVVVTIGVLLFLLSQNIFGFRGFIVTSASMEPAISTGSFVVTQPVRPNTLKQNDIISFIKPDKTREIITHRIITISQKANLTVLHTKGDKNTNTDPWILSGGGVIGKVILTVPFLGYFLAFTKSLPGIIIFVLIPSVFVIYNEVSFIFRSLQKRKALTETNILLIVIVLPFIMSSPPASASQLSNTATLSNNQFSVHLQAPHIVINEVYYQVDQNHGVENIPGQNNEWVELYNPTDEEINLKDWTLTDNSGLSSVIHANATIVAHDFALLSKDNSTWKYWDIAKNTTVLNLGNAIGDGLDNTGDHLILKNPAGGKVDSVSWGIDTTGDRQIQNALSPEE